MESNVSSTRCDVSRSGVSTNRLYGSTIFMPYTVYITNDTESQKVTINANSSKELTWTNDPATSSTTYLFDALSCEQYFIPSYMDGSIVSPFLNQTWKNGLGPILGFYTGAGHWGISGINRFEADNIYDNGNLFFANTNSSSGNMSIDTTECNMIALRIKQRVVYPPEGTGSHLSISDYFINSLRE